jgi:ABC-2 type transport system ATP-binding protein
MSELLVDGITKRYGRSTVLHSFTVEVGSGSVHGLLGPNGSGKSTCLHILCGLIDADEGAVVIHGTPMTAPQSRRMLGFAPDDLPLPGSLTGAEYLRFHDALRHRDDHRRAAQLCAELDLREADLDRMLAEYSHGMRRKVQLVAALMHRPRLLVLDEPYRGLDPAASAALRELVDAFADQGGAVLVATHDMLRAERDCQEVTILHEGRVVGRGTPDQLMRSTHAHDLESVFLRLTSGVPRPDRHALMGATLFSGDFS